jgi:hypothetical protein
MPHPKVRTWTLGTLDRGRGYWLYFDPVAFRWEVAPGEAPAAGPLTTRATVPSGPGAGPRPSEAGGVRPDQAAR